MGRPSKPTQDDIHRLTMALSPGHWIKGRDLQRNLGFPTRMIRAVAEATGEVISGELGYKLTTRASSVEIEIARADLLSRARHIDARARKLQRVLTERNIHDYQDQLI